MLMLVLPKKQQQPSLVDQNEKKAAAASLSNFVERVALCLHLFSRPGYTRTSNFRTQAKVSDVRFCARPERRRRRTAASAAPALCGEEGT